MRTFLEIVTNSFANGYIRKTVFNLATCCHVAYRPKAILSTDFPSASAHEYGSHGLCAHWKFAAVVLKKLQLDWSVVDCRKVITVFRTAAVCT